MNIILQEFIKDTLTSQKSSSVRFFLHKSRYRTWKYSFGTIYDYSCRFSALLCNSGIKSGDMAILKGASRPEWIIAFIGCIFSGVIIVPLDVKSFAGFDIKVINKVKARAIICDNYDTIKDLNAPGGIGTIFLDDIFETLDRIKPSGHESKKDSFCTGNHSPEKIAEIVFTSGTITEPKGVEITCGNIEASLKSVIPVMAKYSAVFKMMIRPKILSMVPLSHMYGQLIGIFTPMFLNSSVIFTDDLSPKNIMKTIRDEKIWILGVLPKMLEMIKDYIVRKYGLDTPGFAKLYDDAKKKKWQLRLLRFIGLHFAIGPRFVAIMVGGAVLDRKLDEFFRCLAYAIFQGYGLTETSPLITISDPVGSVAGSIGKLLPGQEIKIVNGEIFIKGPNVSPGYYKDKERTQKAFANGWFRTGDYVKEDADGNFFFRGRRDGVIVKKDGLNVFPEDIENVLKSDTRVRDCAVIGTKEDGNESITAVLILKVPGSKDAGSIIESANKKLGAYQKIDRVFIWDDEDFPRTSTMKIMRSTVRDKIEAEIQKKGQILQGVSLPGQKPQKSLLSLLDKLKGKKIKPGSKLEDDLGLDSLEIMELSAEIEEKFDVEIDSSFITKDTTAEELESIIKSPPAEIKEMPFFTFPYWKIAVLARTLFQYFMMPFIFAIFRLKVIGPENLKHINGPVVFAANHSSNLDAFAVLFSLPLKLRKKVTALMSIEHHFQNFFYSRGNILRRAVEAAGFYLLVNLAVNACPLSRTHGYSQVLKNTGKLIDRGWSIMIFPEGGVTADGKMKNFEPGVGIIANDMKIPVVPVKIEGIYNLARNGILPWGHRPKWPMVKVTFGKPILFKNKNYYDIANTIEDIIKNQL